MAYESVREEIDAMRRDLRWAVPVWLGMAIAFGGWRAAEGDSAGRVVASLAICVAAASWWCRSCGFATAAPRRVAARWR